MTGVNTGNSISFLLNLKKNLVYVSFLCIKIFHGIEYNTLTHHDKGPRV